MIDVTDLYDAFHAIAQSIWRDFGFAVDDESWDDIVDALEHDLFLAGCAQRISQATSEQLDPDEIPARIRLVTGDGNAMPGAGGQYHSHAFYPDDETGDVPNAIMTANLMSRSRDGVSLQIAGTGEQPRKRGAQLPTVS